MSGQDPAQAGGATRRTVLAAGAALPALAAAPAGAASPGLDLSSDSGRLRAYMQMRGALDGRLVIGFISGVYYGVVGDEMRPLYGALSATFARFRPDADGGFRGATYEAAFFTDLDTGAPLDRWRNPYTNETVDVPQRNIPPAVLLIRPDLRIVPAHLPPGLTGEGRVISTLQAGPDVWITERTTSVVATPGTPQPVHYAEIVGLHALQADFATPGAARVPCHTSYTSVVGWRPWLKMGERPGHLMGDGMGRYGAEIDALPANLLAGLAQRRPEVLKHPDAPLSALLDA